MRIRDCPAAVSGNDRRHRHWAHDEPGKRRPVVGHLGGCARESEDLSVRRAPPACGGPGFEGEPKDVPRLPRGLPGRRPPTCSWTLRSEPARGERMTEVDERPRLWRTEFGGLARYERASALSIIEDLAHVYRLSLPSVFLPGPLPERSVGPCPDRARRSRSGPGPGGSSRSPRSRSRPPVGAGTACIH